MYQEGFDPKNYSWSPWQESKGKKVKYGRNKNEDWVICEVQKFNTISQKEQDRLHAIKKMKKCDFNIHVKEVGISKQSNQLSIITEAFQQAQNLSGFMSNDSKQLPISKIKELTFHIVRGLLYLQENKVAHLKLTPSSIFIFRDKNQIKKNQKIMVKIGKPALMHEDFEGEEQYIRPDYVEREVDPFIFEGGSNETFVYDAWSFSVLIYKLVTGENPFSAHDSKFSKKKVRKFYNGEYNYLKEIEQSSFLNEVVELCMKRDGNSKRFNSWQNVYRFYLSKEFISKLELKPISDIYINHIRLMFLFSSIFVLLVKNVEVPLHQFWQNPRLKTLAWGLVHLSYLLHELQIGKMCRQMFKVLPQKWIKIFQEVSTSIRNEKTQSEDYRPGNFENDGKVGAQNSLKFIEKYQKLIVRIRMELQEAKPTINNSGIILFKFVEQLLRCLTKMMEKEKEQDSHHEDIITIMHESQKFKDLAMTEFNFKFPPSG